MLTNECEVYLCMIQQEKVGLLNGQIPRVSFATIAQYAKDFVELGTYQNHSVLLALEPQMQAIESCVPLRALLSLPPALFNLVGKAVQLDRFHQNFGYCSICGGRNDWQKGQMVMQCTECQHKHYPVIAPCIIVAVTKGAQILLARHHRHTQMIYTLIAGFVEVGETLEQCVARELKEEVGIEVKDIQYVKSQPWAFPSNLMLGFRAVYANGEFCIDTHELQDANWFSFDALPPLPPQGTISRDLIEYLKNDLGSSVIGDVTARFAHDE